MATNNKINAFFSILFIFFIFFIPSLDGNVMKIHPHEGAVMEDINVQPPVKLAGTEPSMIGKTLFSSIKTFEYDASGKRIPCGMTCAHFELYKFNSTSGERFYMIALGLDENYKPIYIPLKFYLHEYSSKSPSNPDYVYFYLADDCLARAFYKAEISSLYHSYEGDFVGAYFKESDNPYHWIGMRIVRKSEGFYMLQFIKNGDKTWYELNGWFTYNYGLNYVYGYVENIQDLDALPKCPPSN